MDRSVLLLGFECGFICGELRELIEKKGFSVEYFEREWLDGLGFRRRILFYLSFIAELLKKGRFDALVIGSPISFRLILWLNVILFFVKTRRLILLIPPSERHVNGFKLFLYSTLVSFLLLLIKRRGVNVLLIYTSPAEKQLFEQVFYSDRWIYYPVYSWRPRKSAPPPLRDNPPVLFIYALNEYQVKWLPGVLAFLGELGVKPLVFIGFEDPPRKCIVNPFIVCIYSESYDQLLIEATIVLTLHVSPESNLLIAKSIGYRRPVITRRILGMGRFYEETGLIIYEDVLSPENIATAILNVLNSLDKYRQIGLRTAVLPPRTRYFEEILDDFLKS